MGMTVGAAMTDATGQGGGATAGGREGAGTGRTDRHPSDATPARAYRQAVILVHGIGEPMPLGTLRGFVQTMWRDNPKIDARKGQ